MVGTTALQLLQVESPQELPQPGTENAKVLLLDVPSPKGTVFVVHSVFQDQPTSLPMGRAMQRSGFRSLVLNLEAGQSFGRYVETVSRLVRRFKTEGPVYGVGHSMGADILFAAQSAGGDPLFDSLVALGFPIDQGAVDCPLIIGAGAWDQVHTRGKLDSAAGEAQLVISPFSDHSQESLDPYLQRAAVEHFGGTWGGPSVSDILAQGVLFLALAAILNGVVLPLPPTRLALICGALALIFLGLNFAEPQPLWSTAAVAIYFFGAWQNSGKLDPRTPMTLALFFVAIGLSWLAHGYQSVAAQPNSILGLPVALFCWFPILASRFINALTDPIAGQLSPVFLSLIVIEVAKPGLLLGSLRRAALGIARRAQSLEFKLKTRPSKGQLGLLLVLLLGGILAWKNVAVAGYALQFSDISRLLWKMFTLVVLPLACWVFLLHLVSSQRSDSSD